MFCESLSGVAGIPAIEAIAGRESIGNVDFAGFAVPGMLLAIFRSNFAVFAVPVMLLALGTTKTLAGTAQTTKFQQKIGENLPGTAKPAKLRFSNNPVAAIAAIESIARINADINRGENFPIRINLDCRKKT